MMAASRKKIIAILCAAVSFIAFLYYREVKKIDQFPVNAWTDDVRADCAIVLTGGAGRVREGFDLLSQGRTRKLIISGVYPHAELRDIFPQIDFYGSIDAKDVVLEKRSGTTYGNAQQTLPLVEALRCRDVVLITSVLHMYRARRIFNAVFPEDITVYPLGVVSGRMKSSFLEILVEATKSIFYSFWAY